MWMTPGELLIFHTTGSEGEFSKDHLATPGGGALPGESDGIEKLPLSESEKDKLTL
jgi:hypothetical protein